MYDVCNRDDRDRVKDSALRTAIVSEIQDDDSRFTIVEFFVVRPINVDGYVRWLLMAIGDSLSENLQYFT